MTSDLAREAGRPFSESENYTRNFLPLPADIDELGHVNNAAWVRWMQEVATSHWRAVARAEDVAAYIWVVTRHEIDYLGNIGPGEAVTARTWVPDPPKGARFARHIEFADASGRVVVRAVSTWAMIDRATGRPARITAEIAAPFYTPSAPTSSSSRA